jgi:glycerol uptake facilitator-like aquaporin
MEQLRPTENDVEKQPYAFAQKSQQQLKGDDAQSSAAPFVGRIGGNQAFVLDRTNASHISLLQDIPDAAPNMTIAEQFDLKGFKCAGVWKAALVEGMGTLMLVYITIWAGISPDIVPNPPDAQLGNFDNSSFIGPLIGGITNFLLLSLFIFIFGAVSGAHLNPLITIGTFCARLCSFPRMLLYVSFQTAGSSLAGLLVRASYGSRDFKVGGCFLFTELVPVGDAFVIELVASTLLLFLAFGVGLDPRQRQTIGPSLAPFLVGLSLGTLSLATAFSRFGYGGASMNPARCFGSFVGSKFNGNSFHWIHW